MTVVSRYDGFEEVAVSSGLYSVGLHPWHLAHAHAQWDAFALVARHSHVVAVGECGLDRLCTTPWVLQQELFAAQVDLAGRLGKPLIIHCVRAFGECLAMLKPAAVPFVVHGFNRNEQIARQVLDAGGALSFGAAVLRNPLRLAEVVRLVPDDRLFLETDEAHLAVSAIYTAVAAIRNTQKEALILQIESNFNAIFKLP